jgi:hypothetical protein
MVSVVQAVLATAVVAEPEPVLQETQVLVAVAVVMVLRDQQVTAGRDS